MADLFLRGVAFLVFLALVGGGTYAAYQTIGSSGAVPRGIVLDAVEWKVAAAPGGDVAFGFVVKNGGSQTERVTLSALDAAGLVPGAPVHLLVPPQGTSGGFLTFHVPGGLPAGPRTITAVATTEAAPVKRSTMTVTLDVLSGDQPAVRAGDSAVVEYVGWLSDGTMFGSDVASYIDSALPKAAVFKGTPGNFTIDTNLSSPASTTLSGFTRAIVGIHKGETKFFVLSPEEGFGNKTNVEKRARISTAPRTVTLPRGPRNVSYDQFARHVNSTNQGNAASYMANSTFRYDQKPNNWTFRILCIRGAIAPGYPQYPHLGCDDATVTYLPDPALGDAFHVHQGVNLTDLVTAKNATSITFKAEQPAPLNGTFTFFDYWPDGAKLIGFNETTITVENDPTVETTFQDSSSGTPVTFTVEKLDAKYVYVSTANTAPFAGETLYFAVTVLDVVSQV